jgi:FHA domain
MAGHDDLSIASPAVHYTPSLSSQLEGAGRAGAAHPTCPRCGKIHGTGERFCFTCGIACADTLMKSSAERGDETLVTCCTCGVPHRRDLPVCVKCGAVFSLPLGLATPVTTADLASTLPQLAEPSKKRRARAPTTTTLCFEVGGLPLTFSIVEKVIVGRCASSGCDDVTVDLSGFGAYEMGVSRRHVRIGRRGTLVYAADIGSRNGTWLNGQQLLVYGERLLHNGDDLRLSHLSLHVKSISESS